MNSDTPKTNAAWDAAKNQTDTNDVPDWGCVAHDMRDKCAELERENAQLRAAGNRMREHLLRTAGDSEQSPIIAQWDDALSQANTKVSDPVRGSLD